MQYPPLPAPVLGKSFNKNESYLIVGAGISGLFLGYYLKKQGVSFKIVEKQRRAGGLLQTDVLQNGIAEAAANGYVSCYELEQLLDDINLKPLATNKESRSRYIYSKHTLSKLPVSIVDLLTALGNALLPKSRKPFTVADFGHIFLNKPLTDNLLSPGLSGVYAAYAHELGLQAVFPSVAAHLDTHQWLPGLLFKKKARKKKPLHKGTHSFEGGMTALITQLAAFLKDDILYNTDAVNEAGKYQNTIFCTPAFAAGAVVKDPIIVNLLSQVTYTPVVSATFILQKEQLGNFKPGFGCLIPEQEGKSTLGILFNNYIFQHRVTDAGLVSLTCIARNKDWATLPASEVTALVFNEVKELLQINGNPVEAAIFQYEKGIPLYSSGLPATWIALDQHLKTQAPNIHLFGNYTGRISIRGLCQAASQWTTA